MQILCMSPSPKDISTHVLCLVLSLENSGPSRVGPEESNENGPRYVSTEKHFNE